MTFNGNMDSDIRANDASSNSCANLPEICNMAADHLAGARIALESEAPDSAAALTHLDEAISCLQRLWQLGNARKRAINLPEESAQPIRRSA